MKNMLSFIKDIKRLLLEKNKLFDKIQNKNYFNYLLYFFMVFSSFLVKLDVIYIDIIVVVFFSVLSLLLKFDKILIVYVFLYFFDSVMKINLIGGGITRKKYYLYIIIFLSLYFCYAFLIETNIFKIITLYVNICFFIILSNYFSWREQNVNRLYYEVLETILYGVSLSIIYGLLVGNFMTEPRMGYIVKRFNGTMDPNFLAFYINIAFIILLFQKKKWKLNKKLMLKDIIICFILLLGLLLTKSVTGILINIVSMVIFTILRYKNIIVGTIKKHKKVSLIIIIFLTTCTFLFVYYEVKKNYNNVSYNENGDVVANNRIADIILSIKTMNIDRLTSHKTNDWKIYWDDIVGSSVLKLLFGHGMYPTYIYSPYFNKEVESHNTYLDLTQCYGVVGFVIIMSYIIYKIKNNIFLCQRIDDKTLKYLRIMILVYGIELSIYTGRIFWLTFII